MNKSLSKLAAFSLGVIVGYKCVRPATHIIYISIIVTLVVALVHQMLKH